MSHMIPANVVEITTPKKILLNGLWFGPEKPKRVIIWVHGLASSTFSRLGLIHKLIDDSTAVLAFNNRGATTVTRIRKINPRKKDGFEFILAGGAHEVFTECADDIQGAIDRALAQGASEIYLAGHSTGAQKSVYYATRANVSKNLRGVILLAPLSDYAGAVYFDKKEGRGAFAKGLKAARSLVKSGKKHDIVPGWWQDAQRFISLNTPESTEEIFSYAQPKKKPKLYRSLELPVMVFLAEDDEYGDRPMQEIAQWFLKNSDSKRFAVEIVEKTPHSFHGAEERVAASIKKWLA